MKYFGTMLAGLSKGFNDYNLQQEDLGYLRQERQQQMAGRQLENQSRQLQNMQQGLALKNAADTHAAMLDALKTPSADDEAAHATHEAAPHAQVGGAPAGGAPMGTGAKPGTGGFSLKGPMTMQQLASLDEKYGLPKGTAYGLMNAESSGNPNAVSPKGAQGLFQVMPSTAANPGYGLKPFSPKDPDAALGYFAKLYQKAGGDMKKALGFWNAGPAGNPNNPETQGFIPRVMQGAEKFGMASAAEQAKSQPSPADQVAAKEQAGAPLTLTDRYSAVGAQQQRIQMLTRAAQIAQQKGNPEVAQALYGQATELQKGLTELQKKTLDTQKEANEEVPKLAAGVHDQSSYDNFIEQLKQNPAMADATRGLNLTGDYAQDRQKVQTLADRSMTLKEQSDLKIRQEDLKLKQQTEQREQAKQDLPKQIHAQAIAADSKREQAAKSSGVPFVPSPLASGLDPAVARQTQLKTDAANEKLLASSASSAGAARTTMDLAQQGLNMLNSRNPVQTGGYLMRGPDWVVKNASDAQQQAFEKVTGQLVKQIQSLDAQQGGGRSAFTAAMFDRIRTTKPGVGLEPATNRLILGELYTTAYNEQQHQAFTRQFHEANPHAPLADANMMWETYQQSLGSPTVPDKDAPFGFRLNPNRAPVDEHGQPNKSYVSWQDYFRNNFHAQ